jgi:S1-C subfamily serine protease
MLWAVLGAVLGTAATFALLAGQGGGGPEEVVTVPLDRGTFAPTIEIEGGDDLDRVAAVAEVVLPTVVQINIGAGGELGLSGNGSGVVYRSDGHIITNNHVVVGASALEVVFPDGSVSDAEVVGRDARMDLAVVRVDRDDLTAIQIGDSSAVRVGELAVAIGSPFGLDSTVTAGVVSALDRLITVTDPEGRTLSLPSVIQTDASINPGNSGGPLVNGEGRLIGINSAILTRAGTGTNAGVGFAIPVGMAVRIAEELIATGQMRHPFLGVAGLSVSREVAERVGVQRGAYVEQVVAGTPADEAGLREGDVVVAFGDERILSMQDLMVAILDREVGETVGVTYVRDRSERTTDVTLIERPEEDAP